MLCAYSFNHVQLVARQTPLSLGFPRQEYWSGLPSPPPGDLPNPRIEPRFSVFQVDSLPSDPPGKPMIYIYMYVCMYVCIYMIYIRFSYKIRNKVRMPALPTPIHWRSWLQQLIMKKDIKEIQIDKEFKISVYI